MDYKMKVDHAGQRKKTRGMKMIDAAAKRSASRWASLTVKRIKRGLSGEYLKTRSGKLKRVVGMRIESTGKVQKITLGTNVGATKDDVVYARIHEEGGWIFPKTKRALTIPLPGIKGRVSDFGTFGKGGNLFVIKSKRHGLGVIAMKTASGKRWRPLFVLRTSVKMPARHWFSRPIAEQHPLLKMMMSEDYLYAEAMAMAERSANKKADAAAEAQKAAYMGGE